MVLAMKVNTLKERSMDQVNTSGHTDHNTQVIGKMTLLMAEVHTLGKTEDNMSVIGRKISCMDMVNKYMKMVEHIKENIKK